MAWRVRRVTWCQTLILTTICALLAIGAASQAPCFIPDKLIHSYCILGKASAVSILATCCVGLVPLILVVAAAFKHDNASTRPQHDSQRTEHGYGSVRQEQGYRSSGHMSEQNEMAALAADRVNKSRVFLYVGHFFSAWSDRMWQFLVPVVFMDIFVNSLMPSAVFGLSIYSFTVVAMPFLGKWLDHTPRRCALISSIIIENIALVGSTLLLSYMLMLQKPDLVDQFGLSDYIPFPASTTDARLLSHMSVMDTVGAVPQEHYNVTMAKTETGDEDVWTPVMTWCFVGVIVFGVLAEVNNQAQTIAVEKDWVNVLARVLGGEHRGDMSPTASLDSHSHAQEPHSHSHGSRSKSHSHSTTAAPPVDIYPITPKASYELGKLNRTLRRIDLSCKVLAPGLTGVLLQYGAQDSDTAAAVAILVVTLWNILAFPVECVCHSIVYHLNHHALSVKVHRHEDGTVHVHRGWEDGTHVHSNEPLGGSNHSLLFEEAQRRAGGLSGPVVSKGHPVAEALSGIRTYVNHRVMLMSVAYCLLYMTVLDGGAIVTSYLRWAGIPAVTIAASRGLGAVFGLLGTSMAACLHRSTGSLTRAGLWSIWLFWLLITPACLGFFFRDSSDVANADAWASGGVMLMPAYAVMASMVVSRAGLWAFDLIESQLLQEWVEEYDLSSITSVQTAVSQISYIGVQLLVLQFSHPATFYVLVNFSTVVVLIATLCYTWWYIKHDDGPFQIVDEVGQLKLKVQG